jgi:hypothetical protein
MHSPKNEKPTVGTTIPDLILRIFTNPFLTITLFLLLGAFIVAIAVGYIEVSWGDSGVKVTQGHHGAGASERNITGNWRGTGKDLTDSDQKLTAKYTYNISMAFTQRGSDIAMKGT